MTTARQTAGMMYYRQENGILVYRFQDNRRETVDAWIEQAYQDELDIHAAGGGIACMLLDLGGNQITPYAIVRVVKAADLTPPGLQEWTAILSGNSFAMRLVQSVMVKFPATLRSNVRVFNQEAEALAWLEQKQHEFEAEKKNA